MTGAKVTRLSKAISVLLVALFLVQYFVPWTKSYLALVPGRTLPCVWNLVTAGLLTTNAFELVFEVVAVLFMTRLVEPLYGSKEFLKFFFIVDFATNFAVFVGVYIAFAITVTQEGTGALLYTEFSGFHGILAGLLVAVKQVMPDHEFKLLGFVKLRVKYIPLLYVLASTGLAVGFKRLDELPFVLIGTYSAWLYLRFFQQQADTPLRGDPSEDFAFSGFFPGFMAPPIDMLARVLGAIFRLRHQPSAEGKALIMSNSPSMLGSDAADANRRRERGAKALEERIVMKKQQNTEGDVEAAGSTEAQPTSGTTGSS